MSAVSSAVTTSRRLEPSRFDVRQDSHRDPCGVCAPIRFQHCHWRVPHTQSQLTHTHGLQLYCTNTQWGVVFLGETLHTAGPSLLFLQPRCCSDPRIRASGRGAPPHLHRFTGDPIPCAPMQVRLCGSNGLANARVRTSRSSTACLGVYADHVPSGAASAAIGMGVPVRRARVAAEPRSTMATSLTSCRGGPRRTLRHTLQPLR